MKLSELKPTSDYSAEAIEIAKEVVRLGTCPVEEYSGTDIIAGLKLAWFCRKEIKHHLNTIRLQGKEYTSTYPVLRTRYNMYTLCLKNGVITQTKHTANRMLSIKLHDE